MLTYSDSSIATAHLYSDKANKQIAANWRTKVRESVCMSIWLLGGWVCMHLCIGQFKVEATLYFNLLNSLAGLIRDGYINFDSFTMMIRLETKLLMKINNSEKPESIMTHSFVQISLHNKGMRAHHKLLTHINCGLSKNHIIKCTFQYRELSYPVCSVSRSMCDLFYCQAYRVPFLYFVFCRFGYITSQNKIHSTRLDSDKEEQYTINCFFFVWRTVYTTKLV